MNNNNTINYHDIPGVSVSRLIKFFQCSCTSSIICNAKSRGFASPLKANWFSGLPSGILYILNHSTVAFNKPG